MLLIYDVVIWSRDSPSFDQFSPPTLSLMLLHFATTLLNMSQFATLSAAWGRRQRCLLTLQHIHQPTAPSCSVMSCLSIQVVWSILFWMWYMICIYIYVCVWCGTTWYCAAHSSHVSVTQCPGSRIKEVTWGGGEHFTQSHKIGVILICAEVTYTYHDWFMIFINIVIQCAYIINRYTCYSTFYHWHTIMFIHRPYKNSLALVRWQGPRDLLTLRASLVSLCPCSAHGILICLMGCGFVQWGFNLDFINDMI